MAIVQVLGQSGISGPPDIIGRITKMEEFIGISKERTTTALERFLRSLSHVPADRLTWSPAPTAKSALEIARHCAGFSVGFATIIAAGKFPASTDAFLGPIESAIKSITTLDGAEAMLRMGIAKTVTALDCVKPEQIGSMIDAPSLGQTPFSFFLTLPAMHLETHAAQIDYLQTCWGDSEVHL